MWYKLGMHSRGRGAPVGIDSAKGVGWQDAITASGALTNWNAEPCEDAELKRLHAVMVGNGPSSIDHTEAQEQCGCCQWLAWPGNLDHLSKWTERSMAMDICARRGSALALPFDVQQPAR